MATLAARPGVRSPGNRAVPLLAAGERVSHDAFGLGTVVRVEGEGERALARVDFGGTHGVERLLLRYAPVEKLLTDARRAGVGMPGGPAGAAGPSERDAVRLNQPMGLTGSPPLGWISTCTCGPVECPVSPERATICPGATVSPALTLSLLLCAYQETVPSQ